MKATVSRLDKLGRVTDRHMLRETSRYSFFFLEEGESVTRNIEGCIKNFNTDLFLYITNTREDERFPDKPTAFKIAAV